MRIAEAKLRQIVLEEVQLRLLDFYIDQEIERLISEDEDWKAAKWRAQKKNIRNAALGALALGSAAGGLKMATDDRADTQAAASAERQQQNLERRSTIKNAVKSLEDQSRNLAAQMWHAGPGEGGFRALPTNPLNKSEAILSPDWSVLKQAQIDKANGTPAYEIDQDVLDAAESFEDLKAHYKIRTKASNTAKTFFKDFDPSTYPYSDASKIQDFAAPADPSDPDAEAPSHRGVDRFVSSAPGMPSATYAQDDGSPGFQNIVHVPFEDIPEDYVLPRSGLTKKELYKAYYYGQGMSLEEFGMLKGDSPEETSELDPELIQKTQDRADSLKLPKDNFTWKENKVTWKNYKNRKKMLA